MTEQTEPDLNRSGTETRTGVREKETGVEMEYYCF